MTQTYAGVSDRSIDPFLDAVREKGKTKQVHRQGEKNVSIEERGV